MMKHSFELTTAPSENVLALAPNDLWERMLELLRQRLSQQIFDNWFSQIKFVGQDNEQQTVGLAGGPIVIEWIKSYYGEMLDQMLTELGLKGYRITWQTSEAEVPESENEFSQPAGALSDAADEELIFTPTRLTSFGVESSPPAAVTSAAAAAPALSPSPQTAAKAIDFSGGDPIESSLNPKYTFEKFVVGTCNQFAHAAAKATAELPGKTYNPLFIYGGVGLGKTHLMHAIGHCIKQQDRHKRVAYITSEKFMNELINAIRYDRTQAFRDKYRSIDVLLMDDVQFMAGKERTQEEFFHTFNALHNGQKQIVISSDCPPREIPTLEERLHSRFEWGLIADIEPPDLETKVAILKRKADLDGIYLPDDIAIFIASKIKSNVRELEGSLVRLVAISSLRGVPISKMLAQDALKNIIDAERPEGLTIERISRTVASHYKMTVDELKSKNNSRAVAFPRQVAMYLCKRLTKSSFPEIGREFGGKHHTTVMHSVDKIEQLQKEDRNFHRVISELIDSLCS
ncbi:MAG: chromosomal replication initiator protein DnaA [Pyrinomonadaceae bacterium]